jgi:hypothetical protein
MQWEKYLGLILKAIMGIFAFISFLRGEFVWTIGICFSIWLCFLPTIVQRDFNVTLPIILDVGITLSIFMHIIGGYLGLYWQFGFYDHITHFLSSTTIAMIGLIGLYILAFHLKLIKLPPLGFGIFTILFTMGLGVIWEMMEWAFDVFTGTTMQVSLDNTMWDLLFDTLAGTIVGIAATIRLKRGGGVDTEVVIDVRDLKKSVGYKRWVEITEANKNFSAKLQRSFRDYQLLEQIIENIIKESRHIKDKHMEHGKKTKKK